MNTDIINVAGREVANDKPFVLFGGMNVLESRDLAMQIAEHYVEVTSNLGSHTYLKRHLIRLIARQLILTVALAWKKA